MTAAFTKPENGRCRAKRDGVGTGIEAESQFLDEGVIRAAD